MDENAVHVVVAIQVFDDGEQIEGAHVGRRLDERTGEAEFFAGRDLAFYVELRGGILSDEDRGEAGTHAGRAEEADLISQLGKDLVANFGAVEDPCGHAMLAFARACGAKENHSTRKNEETQVMPWEPSGLRI